MKRYLALFCGAFALAGAILSVAKAAGPNAAAQKHLDIAKAAAYRPGHDLSALYETVCRPALTEKRATRIRRPRIPLRAAQCLPT